MIVATIATKEVAILEATHNQGQPHGPIARADISGSAVAEVRMRTTNTRWRGSWSPVSIAESYSTVRNGLDMGRTRSGTTHPTSRIARTDSMTFTRPILPNQGRQKGCGSGHSVGRRIEMQRTTMMITKPGDYTRGVKNGSGDENAPSSLQPLRWASN